MNLIPRNFVSELKDRVFPKDENWAKTTLHGACLAATALTLVVGGPDYWYIPLASAVAVVAGTAVYELSRYADILDFIGSNDSVQTLPYVPGSGNLSINREGEVITSNIEADQIDIVRAEAEEATDLARVAEYFRTQYGLQECETESPHFRVHGVYYPEIPRYLNTEGRQWLATGITYHFRNHRIYYSFDSHDRGMTDAEDGLHLPMLPIYCEGRLGTCVMNVRKEMENLSHSGVYFLSNRGLRNTLYKWDHSAQTHFAALRIGHFAYRTWGGWFFGLLFPDAWRVLTAVATGSVIRTDVATHVERGLRRHFGDDFSSRESSEEESDDEDGSTGSDWELLEAEPEATEPEAAEPEATEPKAAAELTISSETSTDSYSDSEAEPEGPEGPEGPEAPAGPPPSPRSEHNLDITNDP